MFDTVRLIAEVEKRPAIYDVHSKEYNKRQIKENCWAEIGALLCKDWNLISKEDRNERARELVKKWKTIRDSFVKDVRQISAFEAGKSSIKKRRYIFYNQLQFLLPYVKANANSTCIADPTAITDCSTDSVILNPAQVNSIYEPKYVKREDDSLSTIAAETSAGNSDLSKETLVESRQDKRRYKTRSFKARRGLAFNNSIKCSARKLKVLTESLTLQKEEMQMDAYGHRTFLLSFVPILNSLPLQPAMEARVKISQIITDTLAAVTACNFNKPDSLTIASPTPGICCTAESTGEYLILD